MDSTVDTSTKAQAKPSTATRGRPAAPLTDEERAARRRRQLADAQARHRQKLADRATVAAAQAAAAKESHQRLIEAAQTYGEVNRALEASLREAMAELRDQAVQVRELKKEVAELSRKPKALPTITTMPTSKRTDLLVRKFTTVHDYMTGKDKAVDNRFTAEARAKSMSALSRTTSVAGGSLSKIAQEYGDAKVLTSDEAMVLRQAAEILHGLESAAKSAKRGVSSEAAAIKAVDEARVRAAKDAVANVFSPLPLEDALMLSYSSNFHWSKLSSIQATSLTKNSIWDYHYSYEQLVNDAIQTLEDKVRSAILEQEKAGALKLPAPAATLKRVALASAAELKVKLEAKRPVFEQEHAAFLERLTTVRVAVRLMEANKKPV